MMVVSPSNTTRLKKWTRPQGFGFQLVVPKTLSESINTGSIGELFQNLLFSRMKVDGLQKGKTYKFRVKAVNGEGASEPLENEDGVVAKNPYGTPIL